MDARKAGMRLVLLRGNRTQEEIARENGLSVSAIGMYERGERVPRDDIKRRLAEYFGVTVGSIFFDD